MAAYCLFFLLIIPGMGESTTVLTGPDAHTVLQTGNT